MKTTIFLVLASMTVLLSGCTGSNNRLLNANGTGDMLVNKSDSTIEKDNVLALGLTISHRSSLRVDVECIIDYFKRAPVIDSLAEQQPIREPWVRYQVAF